jgi:hypothetical protein
MHAIFLNSDPANLPFFTRTIGPYKIAHFLRKHDYNVQVIDFISKFNENELYDMITKFITSETLVIGLSMTFMAGVRYPWPKYVHPKTGVVTEGHTRRIPYGVFMALFRIKQKYKKIRFVSGGYMSDRMPDYGIFHDTCMTYTGSNEDLMLEYINNLKDPTINMKPMGQLRLPSMINNEKRARMIYDSPRNVTYNIETDDFKWSKNDCILPGEPLPMDIARGCIFACRFCQYPHLGKTKFDYIRGMSYIEEEMLYNYNTFGTSTYYMLDDTFNDSEYKMQEFYNMTQRLPFKVSYISYLRADLIHRFPNMAHLLKESGLIGAYHGLESLHPYASNLVGKGWSGKKARDYIPKLFHDTWKGEVPQTLSFIVGLPKETKEDVLSTRDWFVQNKLHNAHFKALGLFGNNNPNKLYTIESEFDKNSEKYGFWFEDGTGSYEGRQIWKNETWTQPQAAVFAKNLNTELRSVCKAGIWMIPSLEWSAGWSREKIMTQPWGALLEVEEMEDGKWVPTSESVTGKYKEYYDKVMAL